ncbi:unnamed protein product [marine sediment metagenome]|uniref:S5 DRBM domain-containing protein n=1 Tax=marine sediment metagenome TaxID=412755 RepID=X0UR66_9ZZZZ
MEANARYQKHGKKEFDEEVIHIDRISRTIAGGRRIRFRAAVAVGNRTGKVGIGVAKASEVILAVQKAINLAKKDLIEVPIVNGTIPHEIEEKYGAARILLKPASPGTGIIAGGAVRAVVNLAGIKNILSKILGSKNQINNLRATMKALDKLHAPLEKIEKRSLIAKKTKRSVSKKDVSKSKDKGKNESSRNKDQKKT